MMDRMVLMMLLFKHAILTSLKILIMDIIQHRFAILPNPEKQLL